MPPIPRNPSRVPPRRPKRPPADPFAPLSEQAIRSRAAADVRSQVDPLVKQITGRIEGRTRAGVDSIRGYTGSLADSLADYQGKAAGIYGGAQQSQAAVENALASRLSGEGDKLSGELSGKLGQIGAPTGQVQEVAGGQHEMGQGLAGASFGRGSASLSRLISEGAAEQAFAAKQPGVARMGGLRQLGTLERESSQQLADETGEITSRVPGLVQQLLSDYRSNETAKAGAREDRRRDTRDFKFDQQVFQQGVLGDQAQAQTAQQAAADKSAQGWARIEQVGQRLALQGSKTSFDEGIKRSKLGLDEKQYKLAMAREARMSKAVAKKGKAAGGFTASKKQSMTETSFDTATEALAAKAKPVEVLKLLIGKGIPFSIAVKAIQQVGRGSGDNYWIATSGWTK